MATVKKDTKPAPKEKSEMAKKAEQRPENYEDLSAREQWEIDKDLGILDWDGS